jgi:hypothetical protein
MKNFRIKIRAYGYWADFTVQASEEGKPLEDSIIDKLGKNDIKWDKSDFYDQRKTWLTYEEIVNILLIWSELMTKLEKSSLR